MSEIKIERLPCAEPHPPSEVPSKTKDGAFSMEELDHLSRILFAWSKRPDRTLPVLPLLSSEEFLSRYARAFDLDDFEERMLQVMQALYPPQQLLFLSDPARCFESRCMEVNIRQKPVDERVYWKREVITRGEGSWLSGYRGPIDMDAWNADPIRPRYEKELSIMTAYLLTHLAHQIKYPAALFYSMPGWPLAIRIR